MRNFSDLTEREVLALAIANEEEDNRIYTDIAEGLRAEYPGSAKVFTEMAEEESEHRHRLLELYRAKFGEHIPLIRRQDVRGFVQHKPVWQILPLNLDEVRNLAESMETETQQFYRRAAARSEDVSVRQAPRRPGRGRGRTRTSRRTVERRRTCRRTCGARKTRTPAAPSCCGSSSRAWRG